MNSSDVPHRVVMIWACSQKALSLRTSKSPLVPASMPVGVKNAPPPEAGDGVTFPSKDNATVSPSAGRLLSPLVM